MAGLSANETSRRLPSWSSGMGGWCWTWPGAALGHQDAEDIFQATFLLLARKAGSIRKRGSVASWLYGTAYRLSKRARRNSPPKLAREATAAKIHEPHRRVTTAWDELQEVLQDVLAQCPEKYRNIVWSFATWRGRRKSKPPRRQLACPLGTVRSWLARGRPAAKALARRGIALSVSTWRHTCSPGGQRRRPCWRLWPSQSSRQHCVLRLEATRLTWSLWRLPASLTRALLS